MPASGKERSKNLDNLFGHCFKAKMELSGISQALSRNYCRNLHSYELRNVKINHVIYYRNWNRHYFTFLGFYY